MDPTFSSARLLAGGIAWALLSDEKLRVDDRLVTQVSELDELLVLSICGERFLVRKRYHVNLPYHLQRTVRNHDDRSLNLAPMLLHYSGRVCFNRAKLIDRLLPHRKNRYECHWASRILAAS
jgi:hypothetical protein